MKLTNDEIAKVFGMYMGCEIITSTPYYEDEETSKGYITGVSIENEELEIQFHNGIHAEETAERRPFEECKLNITTLSKISDADAIEVAKVYTGNIRGGIKSADKRELIRAGKETVTRILRKSSSYCIPIELHFAIEFLKLKSYAVPLFFAPNHPSNGLTAIELGIAIDRTL